MSVHSSFVELEVDVVLVVVVVELLELELEAEPEPEDDGDPNAWSSPVELEADSIGVTSRIGSGVAFTVVFAVVADGAVTGLVGLGLLEDDSGLVEDWLGSLED